MTRITKLRRLYARFRRDENGSFVFFGFFAFLAILLIGGLGLDLMRAETARANLQNTLDRSVLAAASLSQERDPEDVVRDYFTRAGLGDSIESIEVSDGQGFRQVRVTAANEVPTSFLRLLGLEMMSAPAAGAATEGLSDVEISMVLDISGSMGWDGRLDNLKVAGADFIDTVFSSTVNGSTSISIVPYATQVNAGADLFGQLNASSEHDSSYCIDFAAEDFETTAISDLTPLQQAGHFDPFSSRNRGRGPFRYVCRTEEASQILALSGDSRELKDRIDDLSAGGNTSIEIGVKWGAALLDSAAQPLIEGMADDDAIPEGFRGRPFAWNQSNGMKVLVVMTDGVNTTQYQLDPDFRSGFSDVWRDNVTGNLSIEGEEPNDADGDGTPNERYYWIHSDTWDSRPYGAPGTDPSRRTNRTAGTNGQNANGAGNGANGNSAFRLRYSELWATTTVNYHAYQRYQMSGDWSDYQDWKDAPVSRVVSNEKNDRLQAICNAAKNQGILIFAIGFEVTDDSAEVMENCASSKAHFFRVEGLDLAYAFQAIASEINYLRLSQ